VAGLASWALVGEPPAARDAARHRARLERAVVQRGGRRPRALAAHVDAGLAVRPQDRPPDLRGWSDRLVALAAAGTGFGRWAAVAAVVAVVAGAVVVGRVVTSRGTGDRPSPVRPALPPVGRVTLDAPSWPLDTGDRVVVKVEIDPALRVPGARLSVRARWRGGPVAAAPATDDAVTEPVVEVPVVTAEGAVARIDEFEVVLSDATGARARTTERRMLLVAPPLPAHPDCVGYEPAEVRAEGSVVRAGVAELAVLESAADAVALAEVARGADELCTAGTAADPPLHWWMKDDRLAPAPDRAPWRCTGYDPGGLRLQLEVGGVHGVRGNGDLVLLASFRAKADADLALAVARHYDRMCPVDGDPLSYTYWR
jgi:hypothetical protein